VRHRQAENRFPLYRTGGQALPAVAKSSRERGYSPARQATLNQLCSLFWPPPAPLQLLR
jgi:hypothetical protein